MAGKELDQKNYLQDQEDQGGRDHEGRHPDPEDLHPDQEDHR